MLEISTTLKKQKYPKNIPYEKIMEKVLGKKFELSLVFCGGMLTKKLNKQYRNKDYVANILTFPLSENSGEIFIKLPRNKDFSVLELFIHGLAHLKGYTHRNQIDSKEMEEFEKKIYKIFQSKTR